MSHRSSADRRDGEHSSTSFPTARGAHVCPPSWPWPRVTVSRVAPSPAVAFVASQNPAKEYSQRFICLQDLAIVAAAQSCPASSRVCKRLSDAGRLRDDAAPIAAQLCCTSPSAPPKQMARATTPRRKAIHQPPPSLAGRQSPDWSRFPTWCENSPDDCERTAHWERMRRRSKPAAKRAIASIAAHVVNERLHGAASSRQELARALDFFAPDLL